MKKFRHFCWIASLLAVFSCESEEINCGQSAQGAWFQEAGLTADPELSYRNEMILRNDGTYEEYSQIVKTSDTKSVVGYISLMTGSYEIVGNKLKKFNIEQYGLDNQNLYLNRENLVFQDSMAEFPDVELQLNKENNVLTIDLCVDGPCPEYVCYFEFQTFYRDYKGYREQ